MKRSIVLPNMVNVDGKIKLGEDGVTSFAVMSDAEKERNFKLVKYSKDINLWLIWLRQVIDFFDYIQ